MQLLLRWKLQPRSPPPVGGERVVVVFRMDQVINRAAAPLHNEIGLPCVGKEAKTLLLAELYCLRWLPYSDSL